MLLYIGYLLLQTALQVSGSDATQNQELLPPAIMVRPRQRGVAAQTLRLVPDAVNAVICAPDDG
jgi:hypothetical protein